MSQTLKKFHIPADIYNVKAEILNSIQEWLKPIRQQMEANNRAAMTGVLTGKTGNGLMSQLLKSSLNVSNPDFNTMQQDLQTRGLLTRVKMANITRKQRDSLSTMVRNLAVKNRIGSKEIGKIHQMVAMIETFGSAGREKTGLLSIGGGKEKTVDEEMEFIQTLRSAGKGQETRLNDLRNSLSSISMLA